MMLDKNRIHSILCTHRPIVFYDDLSNSWLSFWNGQLLPAELSLLYCAKFYWKNSPAPESRRIASLKCNDIKKQPHLLDYFESPKIAVDENFDYFYWYKPKVENTILEGIDNITVYSWFKKMLQEQYE